MNSIACKDFPDYKYDIQAVSSGIWDALYISGCFKKGNFSFASGQTATLKVDAEELYNYKEQLDRVIGYFATFPCIVDADALLYVPNGMREFTKMLGKYLGKPVVNIQRRPNHTTKYDFEFSSPEDESLALSANRLVICEDVVTTLGSVAAVRTLLPANKIVHSVAILRRHAVNPKYQEGLIDHYLLELEVPTSSDEFDKLLEQGWPHL